MKTMPDVVCCRRLAPQRTLKESALGNPYGVACVLRMGLNSGLVVVGTIGDNLRIDYSAIGDTTNLASRLQQGAESGTIRGQCEYQSVGAGFYSVGTLTARRGERQDGAGAPL